MTVSPPASQADLLSADLLHGIDYRDRFAEARFGEDTEPATPAGFFLDRGAAVGVVGNRVGHGGVVRHPLLEDREPAG